MCEPHLVRVLEIPWVCNPAQIRDYARGGYTMVNSLSRKGTLQSVPASGVTPVVPRRLFEQNSGSTGSSNTYLVMSLPVSGGIGRGSHQSTPVEQRLRQQSVRKIRSAYVAPPPGFQHQRDHEVLELLRQIFREAEFAWVDPSVVRR